MLIYVYYSMEEIAFSNHILRFVFLLRKYGMNEILTVFQYELIVL